MEEKKSFDKNLFNEKSLYRLNIRELRHIGREMGVPSPTTKKKQELVEYILNVVYGKVEIPVRNIYGRKPNEKNIDKELLFKKIRVNSDFNQEFHTYTFNEEFGALKVSSPSSEYDSQDNVETKIYCLNNGKHLLRTKAFIESPNDIELTPEFVEKFKLENLDIVEIIICENFIKLISVNGIKKQENLTEINVCNTTLHSGQNRDFYLSTKEEINSEIEKLIKNYSDKDITLLLFTKNDYNNKNLQSIKYLEDENNSQIYKKLMLFAGLCEKSALSGEDIIVVIEDGSLMKSILSEFDPDISKRIEKHLYETFHNIIKLGNIYISFNIEEEIIY